MQSEPPDNPRPVRKHPAHGILWIDGQPTIIFDTICTKSRRPWLATHGVHDLLRAVWRQAAAWKVGRYMIMPDHLHLFAAATESPISYQNWVKYWKSQFSKLHQIAEHRWQTDDWDRRMRSAANHEDKRNYVVDNPVRKNLVAKSEDWPFQGVVFDWQWD